MQCKVKLQSVYVMHGYLSFVMLTVRHCSGSETDEVGGARGVVSAIVVTSNLPSETHGKSMLNAQST